MLSFDFFPFPQLRSTRLQLDRITASDTAALLHLRSDPIVLQYLDRAPAKDSAEIEQFIQQIHDDWRQNHTINWAIRQRDQNKLIGTIGFWKIDKAHHRGEIGYMLLSAYHRQGLMQEAMQLVLDYGFRQMRLHSVEANVNPNNTASIRLLEKNGFVQEALFRENYFYAGQFVDSAIFSLLAKGWWQ